MELTFTLGCTRSDVPVTWSTSENPHAYITGRSGSGKSYFIKGMLEQAVQQGALCLVLDYSNDFRDYVPPVTVPFRRIDVTNPEFSLNPLASAESQGALACAQRLLSSLHIAFRMGNRANLALQQLCINYLRETHAPTLRGLLSFGQAIDSPGVGLVTGLERLELLTSLIHCGDQAISLDLGTPGIIALSFDQVIDPNLRSLLVEFILDAVWNCRTSSQCSDSCPLIFAPDESQNLCWNASNMAIRILREGRKYNTAGWFASQYVTSKNANAALGQAALQAYFHPDNDNTMRLAKTLSIRKTGTPAQWPGLISSLHVGSFLFRDTRGRIIVVDVPPRAAQSS